MTLQCSLLGYDISMISMHTCKNSSKFVEDITVLSLNEIAKEHFLSKCTSNQYFSDPLLIQQISKNLLRVVMDYLAMFMQLATCY